MFKKIIKVITNSITTSRLIFAIVLIFLIKYLSNYTFLILMAILYLTDFIDGLLARTFRVQTLYGSLMDTLADKTLNIALMLPLLELIPLVGIVLFLEVLIMVTNTYGKVIGKDVKTRYLGKIKMWVVAMFVILGYMKMFKIINLNLLLPIIIMSCLELVVFIDYLITIIKQKERNKTLCFKSKEEFFYKMFDTEYYLKHN